MEGYDQFFGKNMDKNEIEKMFDAVDIDKSGFIDYTEFVVAAMNEKQLLTNEKLQSAFKMFDKDGSGLISATEIKEVLGFGKTLSEEAVNEIVKQVDANGDGEISFEEFAQMMKRLSA
jgi:calcium-dependent protein kinase